MLAVELRDITKSYGWLEVLKNISLQIDQKECFALLGPNGAGKTTLIKVISTLIRPDDGNVFINGVDATEEPSKVKHMFGLVSHHSYLYEELTARENLEFYADIYDTGKERIDSLLREVNLINRDDSLVSTFSRGMSQRLSIARALLHDPEILILDEPTTGLDMNSKRWFFRMIKQKNNEGKTIILTTHSIEEAALLCSRAGIIMQGRLISIKNMDEGMEEEYFRITGEEDEN
ncbi:MAG TPA: heme ABC exporter ATP-binding protein CcmA [Euryarchaeota archaeon]|nr:SkfA peptide export ATP-binding protein SkfE [archaeon BMS3Bbin15]HDL15096.1 heme ABC exporter ATP-binding protein CcmA [Euryarchaeota archaeon]